MNQEQKRELLYVHQNGRTIVQVCKLSGLQVRVQR